MAITAAQLIAAVSVSGAAAAKADLLGVGESATSAGGMLKGALVGAALGAGVALVGIGVASVKMAGDFQSGMTSLVTGAGESAKNIDLVRQGILKMATDTGTSTKQLTDGMYMIESAGFHGADGLKVLQAAAEGAKVGNADLGTVADATTTILKDFGNTGINASQAVNALVTTVASGKTHMQDLSGALSQILPTAAAAKVSLSDVMGAMATMTGEGIPAANAATYLRQTIIGLEAPGSAAAKALQSVGLSTKDVAAAMQESLPDALKMITDAIGKKFPEGSAQYVEAIKAISGGSKTMQGMLDLTGQHMKDFSANVLQVGHDIYFGKTAIEGWSAVQGDFNQKMDKAKAAVEVLMIQIGSKLLPVAGKLVTWASEVITGFTNWENKTHGVENALSAVGQAISKAVSIGAGVIDFFKKNQVAADLLVGALTGVAAIFTVLAVQAVIAFLATVPTLVVGFVSWAIAAGAAAIATIAATWPLLAIGAAVALLVVGILLLVQHWGEVTKFLQTTWQSFSSWFMGALKTVGTWLYDLFIKPWIDAWNGLVSFFKGAWNDIVAIFQGAINTVVGWFKWLYDHNTYFKDLVDGIKIIFTEAKEWFIMIWTAIVGWIEMKWLYLKDMAEVYFTYVYTAIRGKILQVEAFIHSILVAIGDFILQKWNAIVTFTTDLWNKISSIFTNAWNTYIAKPLGSLWNSISGWFGNIITQAEKWGSNLIQGFINGILGMLGAVGNAASQIASKVAQFLGFHSPTELGPGATADRWAPNFVSMFASGIRAGMPQVQSAFSSLMSPSVSGGSATSFAGGSSSLLPGLAATSFASSAGSALQGPIYMTITMDGQTIAQGVGPHLAKQIRIQTGVRNA